MDPELYNAAVEGNHTYIDDLLFARGETPEEEEIPNERYLCTQTTEEGNTILHIAAIHHQTEFISRALDRLPAFVLLVCRNNSKGQNPLHIASQEGYFDVAMVLVNAYKSYQQDIEGAKRRSSLVSLMLAEEGEASEPWRAKDQDGDTPLHRALRNRNQVVAMYLLGEDPGLACSVNDLGEGPLYLAAVYGLEEFVEAILESEFEYTLSGPRGWTPLHAAVFGCTSEKSVKLLMNKHPELKTQPDMNREIPLHHAAKTGQENFVRLLLEQDRYTANLRDVCGMTPLLRAATFGAVKVIRTILQYSPQSIAICDYTGGTLLHLMTLKSFDDGIEMLDYPLMKRIINEPDQHGNTPLHLAIENQDHIMANILLHTDGIQLDVRNEKGLTPRDLFKSNRNDWSNEMVEIGYELLLSDKHRQSIPETEDLARVVEEAIPQKSTDDTVVRIPMQNDDQERTLSSHQVHVSKNEQRHEFNTLAVMASVLAAITFASLFAIPGGYSETGNAILARKFLFRVYLLSNASSMCGYVLVIFCALWVMKHGQDRKDQELLLYFSIHLLQLSFYGTLGAFATGVYATLAEDSFWLPIAIACLTGFIFLLTLPIFFLLPLAKLVYGFCTKR